MHTLRGHRPGWWLIVLALVGMVSLVACTGTPQGTLVYRGPTEESIAAGTAMPGTSIRYVQKTAEGAEFLIGDQRAVKKLGDSVLWKGPYGPNLTADLGLRVALIQPDAVQLAGTATLDVQNVQPAAAPFPEKPEIAYRMPVTYNVKKGERIPGTLYTYEGQGEQGARIGGLPPGEFPYRQVADSLVWTGRLAEGVMLRLDLRVIFFTDQSLQVAGFATVAVG
jgi:hypothetical protein